jgi:hypothetical protein
MKTTTSKLRRRRRRAAIALLAATAALVGGAEALAPSPASALDGTGADICTIFVFIDCGNDQSQDPGTGGGGGDGTTTMPQQEPPEPESLKQGLAKDKAQAQTVRAYVKGSGDWWEPPEFLSDEGFREARRMRSKFLNCNSRRAQIKRRIRQIRDLDDIDDLMNSGDRELEALRESFNDNQCGNVLNGSWDEVDWDN